MADLALTVIYLNGDDDDNYAPPVHFTRRFLAVADSIMYIIDYHLPCKKLYAATTLYYIYIYSNYSLLMFVCSADTFTTQHWFVMLYEYSTENPYTLGRDAVDAHGQPVARPLKPVSL